MLHLQRNPHIYAALETSALETHDANRIDYADLYTQILSSGVVEEARQQLHTYVDVCLGNIEGFDQCYRAKQALGDVIIALK